jgi:formate-dependent nitrite reductase cytochrome c552 subunit
VTGDLNASILETEVVLQRADGSGHHDFFVYDIDGNLANSAKFPAGERPAPSTCMSCHYSGKSGKFERVGR